MAGLPFKPSDDGENDFDLDDGTMVGLVTIEGQTLTLHDIALKDQSLQGQRSGAGRRSIQALRPNFTDIYASGVMHPFDGRNDIRDEVSLKFWIQILREGLVDRIMLMHDNVEIRAEHIGQPIETCFGSLTIDPISGFTFEPAPKARPAR